MKKPKEIKLQGKEILSLDFGQHTTKFVLGKVSKTTINVDRALEIPTPFGSVEKGRIIDFELLKNHFKEFIKSEKIKPAYVICSVENNEIITREITLPTTNEDQMNKMLEFEVQQYMPIEMNDYIVQSKIIETFEEDDVKKTRLLAAAMPKEMARSYFDMLHAVELNAHVLDLQSNSIDKLLQGGFLINGDVDANSKSVAVIDFGYSHINVVIFDKGQYKFNRLIAQGSEAIDSNLISFLDYTKREAEEKKVDLVDISEVYNQEEAHLLMLDEETMRIRNIVKNVVDSWINEIERIFKFHTSRGAGNAIDKIYIYGGASQMEGLDKYLQDTFNIPTMRIKNITNVTIQNSTAKTMTPFVNALGAMIRR